MQSSDYGQQLLKGRCLALLVVLALLCTNRPLPAQQSTLVGTWSFLRDSDGSTAAAGSAITITFNNAGGVTLNAVGPGQNVTDSGSYSVNGSLISLTLPGLGKSVANRPFTLGGNQLTLPFKLFSGGLGSSTWRRGDLSGVRGGTAAGGGSGGAGGGAAGSSGGSPGARGAGGQSGSAGPAGPGGTAGPSGPGGSAGERGRGGQPGAGASTMPSFAGNYQGRALGEEVRFRHRYGLLILIVKHAADFYFNVNERGEVEGEGTITYDLTRNTEGLDNLVASVRGFMGLMGGIVGSAAPSGALGATAGQLAGNSAELPGLQYDAPHLKYGPELRHFKFRGRLETTGRLQAGKRVEEPVRIYLEQVGNFTLPDGKTDNQLIAAYEVNQQKEEKPFPCWSPFLKGLGAFRKGPGAVWIVEFQEKGMHRNNVRVWEEYSYVWMARQIK